MPIPVIFEVSSGKPLLDDVTITHIIRVLEERGIDHWWTGEVEDFLPEQIQAQHSQYIKGTDTMDVWFDSGVSWATLLAHLQNAGLEERNPIADVYLEGSDQHRGWFQSSLLTSIATTGKSPFANVITHGFVLDKEGVKMSKSDGNVISPLTIINGGTASQL